MHLLQNPRAYFSQQHQQTLSLADCQHGFRSQRSCETHLVQFVHDIISNLDGAVNRGHTQTDLIIMDFAKAFDKIPHRRLLHKLEYYGIRGSTHKWINSWLSGRTQQVVLDGQASDPVPVLSGVPQGSVLGLVLFLIFINDLPDNIRSSVRLFADDCVLYRNIHSRQDCLTLQEDLTSLGQWEANWQMKFNVAKCHSMRGPGCLLTHQVRSCAVGDVRALVPPRKAEWSLSGEPKATGNTFLLLSFYLLVFLSHRILICLFFLISY